MGNWIIDYAPETFPFEAVAALPEMKHRRGNPGKNKRERYKDIITAFDIETTAIDEIEQSVMYVWQWYFDDIGCVFGRTWEQFIEFCRKLKEAADGTSIIAYVHNLSYEYQFLKGIYTFDSEEIFATDLRTVLKASILDEAVIFKDSYVLTGMSLNEFTHKMGVDNVKLSGKQFDYTKKRYAWTPLPETERAYCRNDVVGLVQALKKLLDVEGDNLYTVPLTSTGYVRRDVKRAMHKTRHLLAPSILPTYQLYVLAEEAFRGGDTHANRYTIGGVLKNVKCYDRVSSYLEVPLNYKYPVREFKWSRRMFTAKQIRDYVYNKHKPILFRAAFEGIRLKKEEWGCPYIPLAKTREIRNYINDNGRILSADYLEITLTDIDFIIIDKEYVFDGMTVFDLAYSGYGDLPEPWLDCIRKYYRRKTELKNVKGSELYYMQAKRKANANYGMSAQRPVRQSVIVNAENNLAFTEYVEEDLYYEASKKMFLSYAWGVWITAYARLALHEMLWDVDEQGAFYIYNDTDCVWYQGDVDWTCYNKKRIDGDLKHNGYATDPKGIIHYLGVLELDTQAYKFKTMGAKKYVYQKKAKIAPSIKREDFIKNYSRRVVVPICDIPIVVRAYCTTLHITIAGVNKKAGAIELKRAGGLKAFKSGFVFKAGGGTCSTYNDYNYGAYTLVDGHELYITANVYITDSEYTLGLSNEYLKLLRNILNGAII